MLSTANDELRQACVKVEGKILEYFFKGKKEKKSFSNMAQVLSAPEGVPSGSEAQDATLHSVPGCGYVGNDWHNQNQLLFFQNKKMITMFLIW